MKCSVSLDQLDRLLYVGISESLKVSNFSLTYVKIYKFRFRYREKYFSWIAIEIDNNIDNKIDNNEMNCRTLFCYNRRINFNAPLPPSSIIGRMG